MLIKKWRNEQKDILRQNKILTNEDQSKYFDNHIWPSFELKNPKQILFSYLFRSTLIGYGGLVHISWKDKRAELSYLISTEYTKSSKNYKDYFINFLELIKHIAFEDLKFNKIFTETYDLRTYHIELLEQSGFLLEGKQIKHVLVNGKYTDSLIHGYLREYYGV